MGAGVAGWESQQVGEKLLGIESLFWLSLEVKGKPFFLVGRGRHKKRGDIKPGSRGKKNKKNHKSFHQKHYKELPARFWERCVGSHDIS